ncbi:MAG: FemAB, partial [Pseudomonadota bacterium]
MNAPLAMQHEVRLADLGDARLVQRVEGFVAEQGASLFHRPAWLQAIAAGTRQRAAGFLSEQLGVITGWL